MDDGALSVEQLDALSRAVPEDAERRDLLAYLAVGRACLKPSYFCTCTALPDWRWSAPDLYARGHVTYRA